MGFSQCLFGLGRKKNEGPSSSGPTATPPLEDELKRVFCMYDMNGDRKILAAELRDMMPKLNCPPANDHEPEMMMKKADADGDGFISLLEFKDINGVDEVALRKAFAVFNEDRDGEISVRELQKVLMGMANEVTIGECRMMIRGVDWDGDGMVCFQEFKVVGISSSR